MRKSLIAFLILFVCISSTAETLPVQDTRAFQDRNYQWERFRSQFRFHIQLLALKKYPDNSINIILAEPPNSITQLDIQGTLKGIDATLELKQWQIGVDGWVKDGVISISSLSTFRLDNLLAELNEMLF